MYVCFLLSGVVDLQTAKSPGLLPSVDYAFLSLGFLVQAACPALPAPLDMKPNCRLTPQTGRVGFKRKSLRS